MDIGNTPKPVTVSTEFPAHKIGRGVLYMVWGDKHDEVLTRSIVSVQTVHPELPVHVHELPAGSTLLDKAKMYDASPFSETIYLDADTIVLGRLDSAFNPFQQAYLSCCICECPQLCRYGDDEIIGTAGIEYNSGVVFFNYESFNFFKTWKAQSSRPSAIRFRDGDSIKTMPENDQLSFSIAVLYHCRQVKVLPLNWNFRPQWHRVFFGPIKIWHDYREVPPGIIEFCEEQSKPGAIIDCRELPPRGAIQASHPGVNDADEGYEVIDAIHTLQKHGHQKTVGILREMVGALQPGGRLRISVPDVAYCAKVILTGDKPDDPIEACIMGDQATPKDHHGALFTENKVRQLFRLVGLERVRRWTATEGEAAKASSLNMEGYKSAGVVVKNVHAVMSVPRYGVTTGFDCGYRALLPLGIDLRTAFGAYWHEVLSTAIDGIFAEKPNVEFILTLDYDTIFTGADVKELYRLMLANPHADAICGIQMRRGSPAALLVLRDEDGKYLEKIAVSEFDKDLTKADSAHFGCTLIRASALKTFGRPWFAATPNPDGGWTGEGYVAADVAFWRRWNAEGKTLYQANTVPLGHVEEVAIWPSRRLEPVVQEITNYRSQGAPLETWR